MRNRVRCAVASLTHLILRAEGHSGLDHGSAHGYGYDKGQPRIGVRVWVLDTTVRRTVMGVIKWRPRFGVRPLLPNLDASARDIVTRKQRYRRDSVWVNLNSLTADDFSFKFMSTSPSVPTVDTHLSCNALAVELIWSIYTSLPSRTDN